MRKANGTHAGSGRRRCIAIGRPTRRSLLQAGDQARRVPPVAAGGLDVGIELIDEGGQRQTSAAPPRLVENDAEILAHPVDRETEVELAGRHGLPAILHLPALGGPLGDGGDGLFDVEARRLGEVDGLGEALHHAGDADLVDHLGELPRARRPEVDDHLRIGAHHRLGGGKAVVVAADHDGQRAVLGAGLSAGHRRVEEIEAEGGRLFLELAGDAGRRGGVIDEDGARLHAGEGAVRTEHDGAEIVVVADAGEHEIGLRRRLARRRRGASAEGIYPGLRLGAGPIVDRHVVAAARPKMTGHRVAHYAESEEYDLCHHQPHLSICSVFAYCRERMSLPHLAKDAVANQMAAMPRRGEPFCR
ncbi:hypothetical protein KL86PLE_20157 [uncultured Pleomorphomonas sp.]|uniref:Uncharacterized protein n=1 Tax=uncultured Pleomorphomonas sp. TaxID=442121 RepID=A0A212LDQ6_9HYPH|nr:hypothetical protein KL86PLE_20157 [uncultured Pleomorphomonas sp.]